MCVVRSLLAFTAVSALGSSLPAVMKQAHDRGTLRIAWMGTSITCGLGASSEAARFTTKVNQLFERQTGAKVNARNFCVGGAISLLQIAVLKTSVLPWKPDLVIAELGTLDELYKSVSIPSIEAVTRLSFNAHVPLIALFPYTTYVDVSSSALHKLTERYGDEMVDMAAYGAKRGARLSQITSDGCHPNDQGQQLIADAFEERLKSARESDVALPNRMYGPDLSGIHFQPVVLGAGAERVSPRLFDGQGFAQKFSSDQTIIQPFTGSFLGLLFQFNGVPGKISYRIDSGSWSDVQIAPDWFLNYVLRTDLRASTHTVQLRIVPKTGTAAVLEGLLVN
ncbi:MAG TPA: SGNH/GDSL hydrolase family protein [Bryobacteraceae bacterium]|nr:SGNH/GDSL hydrolase family protein [Bryobacteraceae bacterium]